MTEPQPEQSINTGTSKLSLLWYFAEKSTPITAFVIVLLGAVMFRHLLGQISDARAVNTELFKQLIAAKDIQIVQAKEHTGTMLDAIQRCNFYHEHSVK
jgi:hypothetical protein